MAFDPTPPDLRGERHAAPDAPAVGPSAAPARETGRPPVTGRWIVLAAAGALVAGVAITAGVLRMTGDRAMDQAIELFRAGRYAAAAAEFEAVLERDGDNVTARLYLARVQRRRQAYDAAAGTLREAARLAPADPDVQRELGFLFLDLGRPESAVERFEIALEYEPDDDANWIGLVRALRAAGDPQADAVLRRAPAAVRAVLASNG